MRIGFIGAGNVATAHAAFLRMHQHHVVLSGIMGHLGAVTMIQNNGGTLRATGMIEGTFNVETNQVADVIDSTEILFVTTTANGYEEVARQLARFDLSKRTLFVIPENGFSAVARRRIRPEFFPGIILGTTTSPYVSRISGNAEVSVLGLKKKVEIAASQDRVADKLKTLIKSIFPQTLDWYPDLASIFFGCTNAVVHPPAMLWAKHKLDQGVDVLFYGECVPAALERILAVDDERLTIATKLGIKSRPALSFSNGWYGTEAPDFMTFVQRLPAYRAISAPTTMNHRYLTEDAKCLLVLMRDIGGRVGVATPAMDGVIAEVGETLGEDLTQTGVTLRSLGLQDASPAEILAALNGIAFS
jgi:opine dehydrogenase